MNSKIKRAIISVIVGAVVYILCVCVYRYGGYDEYLQALKMLTAVIGAGCYWIGSNEKEK